MEKELVMSSSSSTRKSLEAVRNGNAGLSERRKALLQRVPHSGDYANFEKDSITTKDIAYLSAATDHEFALLRGKHSDIIFHGVKGHCRIEGNCLNYWRHAGYSLSLTPTRIMMPLCLHRTIENLWS